MTKLEAQLQQGSNTQARRHRTPSTVGDSVLAAMTATEHGTPSKRFQLKTSRESNKVYGAAYRQGG